ncbi:unnamed protein product [Durusdinium trenchii]|uniref:Uncharacterized protein n=1 Tax=Durusdinium trenchii TaxID=1381693 RepID=A0ABP0KCJ5_9DINO
MNHEGDHLAVERAPSKRQERRSQEVWADNLAEEMARMVDVAENFLYVALDTQFGGLVLQPKGPFTSLSEYHWQTLKANVDLTKAACLFAVNWRRLAVDIWCMKMYSCHCICMGAR